MSVYVDDMRACVIINGTRGRWSHLIADSSAELEVFARLLSLNPDWVQFPGTFREHYDITERIRRKAIEKGAIPIGMREIGILLRKRGPLV
ncbi:DUF4031 domain-containing protein [Pseudarthrobacter sp. NPDC092439]|uniref:DUF4031 domain-containing protein n=1 Tax=unclassified Pseudarthrobacter TaxID=2647000 RepID=UPI003813F79A